MAKTKQENTYPLPVGYDDKESRYYIPGELLETYQDLDKIPGRNPLRVVSSMADKLIEHEAEQRVKKLSPGAPRETAKEQQIDRLESERDSYFVPLADHLLRLETTRRQVRAEAERAEARKDRDKAHTCELCGEIGPVVTKQVTPLTDSLESGLPRLTLRVCYKCALVARKEYAQQLGSEKVGKTTRADIVRQMLSKSDLSQ